MSCYKERLWVIEHTLGLAGLQGGWCLKKVTEEVKFLQMDMDS